MARIASMALGMALILLLAVPLAAEMEHVHDYKVQVTPATCYSLGYSVAVCSLCGESQPPKTIEKLPHKYGKWRRYLHSV